MSDALFQNSFYIGNAFNGIMYGVELVLYFQTMHVLRRRRTRHPRTNRFLMVFNTAMVFLITIFVAVQAVFGQEMWIVNAPYPGGPGAYLDSHTSVWYQTLGTASAIILQLMSDAFLIYRCFTVYNNFLILIFPCILWVGSLVFGILQTYYSGIPSGNIFVGTAADVGVSYVCISIGLNVVASCMICGRIAYLGLAVRATRHTSTQKEILRYTGTVPIIVESALFYAIAGIAFAVSYGIGSQISVLFMSIYAMFTCISPQLIITRIADGKAWKRYVPHTTSAIGLREMTSGMSLETGTKEVRDSQYGTTDTDVWSDDRRSSLARDHFPVIVDKSVCVDVAII